VSEQLRDFVDSLRHYLTLDRLEKLVGGGECSCDLYFHRLAYLTGHSFQSSARSKRKGAARTFNRQSTLTRTSPSPSSSTHFPLNYPTESAKVKWYHRVP